MNCLIIDDVHPVLLEKMKGSEMVFHYEPKIKKEEVLERIPFYEGVVVRSKIKLDKIFFAKATKLKFIARAGSGTDNIDVQEAERLGITIVNAPEGNRDAVAEHVIGMLLGLLNNLRTADVEVRQGLWRREANRGHELGHKTVGIIGYGNTGRAVSKRITSFGCRVLAYDILTEVTAEAGAEMVSLDQIFSEADRLTLHIQLTKSNFHLVDQAFFDKFQKPIWLINASRGEVVDTHALIRALETKKVLGAGLDVLENEKLETYTEEERKAFEHLASFPHILFSPHVAGWTFESYEKISEVLARKIQGLLGVMNKGV